MSGDVALLGLDVLWNALTKPRIAKSANGTQLRNKVRSNNAAVMNAAYAAVPALE